MSQCFRTGTHKGDVLRYCATKADEANVDLMIPDRASYALLWKLLSVLVRANGIAEGHEYAELLLGGTFEQRQVHGVEAAEIENSDVVLFLGLIMFNS